MAPKTRSPRKRPTRKRPSRSASKFSPSSKIDRDDEPPGIVTTVSRYLGLTPPAKVPVPGVGYRIKNMISCHWRGVIGFVGAGIMLYGNFVKDIPSKKVEAMWTCMAWLFLIRPVHIPVTALIPVFFLPMTGIMSSKETCACYMNSDIMLFLLGGMVMLLLNNSGNDRRIALSIMCAGDSEQYSCKKMVFKCSIAAYTLGMLSNRLVSSSMITEYFTESIMALEKKIGESNDEPILEEVRFVINNAIQTSASIGSFALLPSATPVLCFRAIYNQAVPSNKTEYPDIFNYLQYTAFAFPVSLTIFFLNLFYHLFLVWKQGDGEMSTYCKTLMEKELLKKKAKLPPQITLHERLSGGFLILNLTMHTLRWSCWYYGWSAFGMMEKENNYPLPLIKDATVAAIFAVLLHTLPCGFSFFKYAVVSKRTNLPKLKAESGILWWKYVDKNINYGYFLLIGSGVAIMVASIKSGLSGVISQYLGTVFTKLSWNLGLFMVVFVSVFIANIISSTAACVLTLPAVLCAVSQAPSPWPIRSYILALAVGISCSMGFTYPYLYTPAYFCHYVGKVPKLKMIKFNVVNLILVVITLWLYLAYYAPVVWDIADQGISFYALPTTTTTKTTTTTTTESGAG